MSIYIIAQVIGTIGYFFYIAAPNFKTQKRVMQVEGIASSILAAQWILLDQPSLAVLNTLSVLIAITGLQLQKTPDLKQYTWILYPIGLFTIACFSSGNAIDILAMCAFCLSLTSKTANTEIRFRGYGTMAGLTLTCSSALALSIPAVIFNILFTAGHGKRTFALKPAFSHATQQKKLATHCA